MFETVPVLRGLRRILKRRIATPESYDTGGFSTLAPSQLSTASMFDERQTGGWRSFIGVPVERKWSDIFTVEVLLAHAQPRTIIELGTGTGGFSAYLAAWSFMAGATFVTFDTHLKGSETKRANYRALRLLHRLGGRSVARDVFEPRTTRQIARLIRRPGITFVYCDNGDKARELRTYAPLLKAGDYIAVHDYGSEIGAGEVAPLLDTLAHWNEDLCERTFSSNRFFRARR